MIIRKRWIETLEAARILGELRISNTPKSVKRALQDLCEHYEKGRHMMEPDETRTTLHSHLHSPEILVRRWSMKALGLIGHPDDMQRIVARLRVEDDREAQTWGTAALLKRANDRSLKEVCSEAGLDRDASLVLAARLYAPESWVAAHGEDVKITLTDDELALKWAIFLIGYGKAPENLFNPRHANGIFLGELNAHDSALVAEYSIWGLVERDDFSYSNCTIQIGDVSKHPANVRKWLYRLAAKDLSAAHLTHDGVKGLFYQELDQSAREGLARGLAFSSANDIVDLLVECHQYEMDESIRELLLAGLAIRADPNSPAGELLTQSFRNGLWDSKLRKRLLVASQRQPMHNQFRAIEAEERKPDPLLFMASQINFGGDNTVGNTFKVSGGINAGVLAGGSISGNVQQIIGQIGDHRVADKEILSAVLDFADKASISPGLKADIAEAAKAVVASPSPETKTGLLEKLKTAGGLLGSAGTAAAGLDKLLDAVSKWIENGPPTF